MRCEEATIGKLRLLLGGLVLGVSVAALTVQTSAAERHHSGDLELTGTQTLLIENETYYQDGEIRILGQARLIVRNATLVLVQEYHEEHNIRVDQNAHIEITDSTVRSSFDISIVTLSGKATGELTRARVEGWVMLEGGGQLDCDASVLGPTRGGVIVVDSFQAREAANAELGRATISNTSIHEFYLALHSTCSTVISDIRPGTQEVWEFNQGSAKSGRVPFDLRFSNVGIENWDVRLGGSGDHVIERCQIQQLYVADSVKVLCRESEVAKPVLILDAGTWTLRDLGVGWVEVLDLDLRGFVGPRVRLEDTTITVGWQLGLRGGEVSIWDSAISRFRPEFDTASSHYTLVNCCVDELLSWWSYGTVEFENCVLERMHTPDNTSITLRGSFRITQDHALDEVNGPWRGNAIITRCYPVQVHSADGTPLVNQQIKLVDDSGRTVQTARTGSTGEAEVCIRFDATNHTRTWEVRVPTEGWSKRIALLSETPVCFPDAPAVTLLPCEEEMELPAESPLTQEDAQVSLPEEAWPSWSTVSAIQSDPVELNLPASRDILALKATSDVENLFLSLELRGPPDPPGVSRYFFYIWGDESREISYRFAPDSAALRKFVHHELVSESPVAFRTSGNTIEVALPLHLLPPVEGLLVTVEARIWPDATEDVLEARLLR